MESENSSQADGGGAAHTRRALVGAALRLFGRKGFDGTSTREIAAEAGANIGSIAYHFGGKEGLRLAAADHIVQTMEAVALRAADASRPPASAEEAEGQLVFAMQTMLNFLIARPEAAEFVPFLLRELSNPTAALDRIYSGVFEPVHKRFCGIWEAATGEPAESDAAKLAVFTMIGQAVYFRIAREAVLRRMGWDTIGPDDAARIVVVATRNLRAAIAARREQRP